MLEHIALFLFGQPAEASDEILPRRTTRDSLMQSGMEYAFHSAVKLEARPRKLPKSQLAFQRIRCGGVEEDMNGAFAPESWAVTDDIPAMESCVFAAIVFECLSRSKRPCRLISLSSTLRLCVRLGFFVRSYVVFLSLQVWYFSFIVVFRSGCPRRVTGVRSSAASDVYKGPAPPKLDGPHVGPG